MIHICHAFIREDCWAVKYCYLPNSGRGVRMPKFTDAIWKYWIFKHKEKILRPDWLSVRLYHGKYRAWCSSLPQRNPGWLRKDKLSLCTLFSLNSSKGVGIIFIKARAVLPHWLAPNILLSVLPYTCFCRFKKRLRSTTK